MVVVLMTVLVVAMGMLLMTRLTTMVWSLT